MNDHEIPDRPQDTTGHPGSVSDPEQSGPDPTRAPAAPPVPPAGHAVPAWFASAAPAAPAAAPSASPGTAPAGPPLAAPLSAPAMGSPGASGPAAPADSAPTEHAARSGRPSGTARVAALVVVASIIGGGAAGLGASYLGNTLWAPPVSSSQQQAGPVTVNNPGSVNETTAIAAKVLPSVVTIQVASNEGSGSGSGVVLSKDGYVVTNTHVVTLGGAAPNPAIRVTTSDGRLYSATIVGTDPIYDLAVIKLTDAEGLVPIEFADSSELNVGSTAVAVGAPLGLANSVTTGVVSALNRSIEIASSAVPDSADSDAPEGDGGNPGRGPLQFDLPGQQQPPAASRSISISVIQTDAAINPGNSGGALVDSEGNLIGINVAIATADKAEESGSIGVGFAIPSRVAQRVSDEIIATGSATHGLLGASVRDAASVEGATVSGAFIAEITAEGAARAGGLKVGDVVTAFNGLPVTGASDLTAQVRAVAAGSEATVTYVRGGRTNEAEVTLGALTP